MEKTVTIDIETIPAQSADAYQRALDAVIAPANYKKQESIDAWLVENRDAVAREALSKTSFDPAQGHICTIAWAIDGGEVFAAHAETVYHEREVLQQFFAAVGDHHRKTFIGHYIGGFDLRFIMCRAVVLGVKIPRCIPRDPKPWDKTIFDTMTAWSGARGSISMDNLAQALGVQGKQGFDGSMVAEAWANGDHKTIIDYCKADVEAARAIWRKFIAVDW
jgi:DNA polymerase elongation subunit (family B)